MSALQSVANSRRQKGVTSPAKGFLNNRPSPFDQHSTCLPSTLRHRRRCCCTLLYSSIIETLAVTFHANTTFDKQGQPIAKALSSLRLPQPQNCLSSWLTAPSPSPPPPRPASKPTSAQYPYPPSCRPPKEAGAPPSPSKCSLTSHQSTTPHHILPLMGSHTRKLAPQTAVVASR